MIHNLVLFFLESFLFPVRRKNEEKKKESGDKIKEGKENNKQMICVQRDVLRTYVMRQGRRKKIKMSKRARYIGRDHDADAMDRAIEKQIAKLNGCFG